VAVASIVSSDLESAKALAFSAALMCVLFGVMRLSVAYFREAA
jgi:hypothetical protein